MKSPAVLSLEDPRSTDAELAGAKAANLARASGLGVPILPGFTLTTAGTSVWADLRGGVPGLREHWEKSGGDDATLVVRSSSTAEDAEKSSMAGQFTSVLDVRGWGAFLDAVDAVVASAERVAAGAPSLPIAVLVQPQLEVRFGGVMFGVDPVTGIRHHVVVEVVPGRPDTLVGGTATAGHLVLGRRGRVLERGGGPDTAALGGALRRSLVRLARDAEGRFGCPQDIEWAVDVEGRLWLLQSRPVTAVAAATGRDDVVLGPGPVAETFPDPLSPLEEDLFLPPLRDGIIGALRVTSAVSDERIARSPVLVAVGGWAAVDLALLGLVHGQATLWQRISPVALVRHVGRAWRVGRTRVALPELADEVLDEVDGHLALLPGPADLETADLVGMLERVTRELQTVHRYEVLAGMLLGQQPPGPSTAMVALASLEQGRKQGLDDPELTARYPEVLALTAPTIGGVRVLPSAAASSERKEVCSGVDELGLRDALRLRTRWLQELLARVAEELGARLTASGLLDRPESVRWLRRSELEAAARNGNVPDDLPRRATAPLGAPLPSAFRLGLDGTVRAVHHHRSADTAGSPAGGGRVVGRAYHRVPPRTPRTSVGGPPLEPVSGTVLVVRHLEPELAPLLTGVDGLVAETGSALSHMAIVAREMGVATVVGVEDALRRFPPGTELLVDGATGEVRELTARTQ